MVIITRSKYAGVWLKLHGAPRVYFSELSTALSFVDYYWAMFVVPPPDPLS